MEPAQPPDGYQLGTPVTLTAKPAKGFAFKEWSVANTNALGKTLSYVVSSDAAITAIFIEKSTNIWIWVGIGLGAIILIAGLSILLLRKR